MNIWERGIKVIHAEFATKQKKFVNLHRDSQRAAP